MSSKLNKSIYAVSFFEGAAVMATELCGSKLLSPFFGSSLFVWAAVIAVTLGSLAAGYFYGGQLSLREDKSKLVTNVLLIASSYMGLMPLVSNLFGGVAVALPLLLAVAICSLLLLFMPMFLMGAASPLIIAIQSQNSNDSGKISGLVYSISTVGGIVATFLSGFLFIPAFGIQITLLIYGILLALSVIIILQKKNIGKVIPVVLALIVLGFTSKPPVKNCIYQADGMLGKLNVIDDTVFENGKSTIIRKLLVNNVVQTEMDLKNNRSVSQYIRLLDTNLVANSNGKALVLGLGGGLTSNVFVAKGYAVDGVELDGRIIETARNYFKLNPAVNAIEDDARHYINSCTKQYKVILIDVFKSEEQPVHVITLESLAKIKSCLTPGGQLIINWHGYLSGERGTGTSILLNTIKRAGFNYSLSAVTDKEDERNLVVYASETSQPALNFQIQEAVTATELVNTDNRPLLEKYNALANQNWRKNYILYYYSGN